MFGPRREAEGSASDLRPLAKQVTTAKARPKLYLSCGTEDPLLEENRALHRHLESLDYEHTYGERSGNHEWGFWDAEIQRVLDWLPLPATQHFD